MRRQKPNLPRVCTALALLLLPGCGAHSHVAMEAPGRPAITWKSPAATPAAPAGAVEQELRAELQRAEETKGDDLTVAAALYNLAILRGEQGDVADAKRLYERALTIRERVQGTSHPDVATLLNNLAGLEARQGEYAAAQPLLERALRIRQTALGARDRLTAESLSNLALLYAAQGKAADAEPLYRQALAILETAGGDADGDLQRVLDNYAALLHDVGRDAEAAPLEERARRLRGDAAPAAAPPQP